MSDEEKAGLSESQPARSMDPFQGIERIGRYRILRRLGEGAMGVVFEAEDTRIGRRVALKVLTRPSGISEKSFEEYRSRFFREAETAGRLSHANVVVIYDVDMDEDLGVPFIAMEFLEGHPLDELLEQGIRLSKQKAIDVCVQVAEGLAHAHERGVVHRDVKPANLVLLGNGKVKILDFGIAKIETSELTRSGQFLGTPNYMSPEQLRDAAVTGRSDIFSLGIILYELLAGLRPFAGRSVMAVAHKICHEDPPPPSSQRPGIPTGVDRIVLSMLKKDPEERPANGLQVAQELRRELEAMAGRAETAAPLSEPQERPPANLNSTLTLLGSVDGEVQDQLRTALATPPAPAATTTGAAGGSTSIPLAARSAASSSPGPRASASGGGASRSLSTTGPRTAPRPRPRSDAGASSSLGYRQGRQGSRRRIAWILVPVVLLGLGFVVVKMRGEAEAPINRRRAEGTRTPAEIAQSELATFYLPDGATSNTPLSAGYLLYLGGNHRDAAAEFERVAQAHPQLEEARLLQGISLVLAGHPRPAVPVLESITAEHPDHEAARWYLAQALFKVGREDDALANVRVVAEAGGQLSASARRVLDAAAAR